MVDINNGNEEEPKDTKLEYIKIFKEIPDCPKCNYKMKYKGIDWDFCREIRKVVGIFECTDCVENQKKPLKIVMDRKELEDLKEAVVSYAEDKQDWLSTKETLNKFLDKHLNPKDLPVERFRF